MKNYASTRGSKAPAPAPARRERPSWKPKNRDTAPEAPAMAGSARRPNRRDAPWKVWTTAGLVVVAVILPFVVNSNGQRPASARAASVQEGGGVNTLRGDGMPIGGGKDMNSAGGGGGHRKDQRELGHIHTSVLTAIKYGERSKLIQFDDAVAAWQFTSWRRQADQMGEQFKLELNPLTEVKTTRRFELSLNGGETYNGQISVRKRANNWVVVEARRDRSEVERTIGDRIDDPVGEPSGP